MSRRHLKAVKTRYAQPPRLDLEDLGRYLHGVGKTIQAMAVQAETPKQPIEMDREIQEMGVLSAQLLSLASTITGAVDIASMGLPLATRFRGEEEWAGKALTPRQILALCSIARSEDVETITYDEGTRSIDRTTWQSWRIAERALQAEKDARAAQDAEVREKHVQEVISTVPCPRPQCAAKVGEHCTSTGGWAVNPHAGRERAYKDATSQ